jgi:hypothetical protein
VIRLDQFIGAAGVPVAAAGEATTYKETVSGSPLPTFKLLKRGLVPVWAFALTGGLG